MVLVRGGDACLTVESGEDQGDPQDGVSQVMTDVLGRWERLSVSLRSVDEAIAACPCACPSSALRRCVVTRWILPCTTHVTHIACTHSSIRSSIQDTSYMKMCTCSMNNINQ
jgi:hypothetical protein